MTREQFTAPIPHPNDPRWGSADRPQKAAVIWHTLQHFCGTKIGDGIWLDIGCGSGGIAASLAPRVKQIIGIDPEPWDRWRCWMNQHPNLSFLQGSYDRSPALVDPESIDVVVCNQVYEHVPDPEELIYFVYSILKPGGACYFAGPNLLFPIEPHVFWPFVHWLPRDLATRIMHFFGSKAILDAHSVNYWEILRLLNNFKIENAIPYILKNPCLFKKSYSSLFYWVPARALNLLTPFSPGFVFVVHK